MATFPTAMPPLPAPGATPSATPGAAGNRPYTGCGPTGHSPCQDDTTATPDAPNQSGTPDADGCNCTGYAYEQGHPCFTKCKGGSAPATPATPAGNTPCPSGQCKDTLTGSCRSYNPNNEKPHESDNPNIKGNCKKLDSFGTGKGGGGGAASSSAQLNVGDPTSLQSDAVWQAILARLNGKTRYTPEVMSRILGQTKTAGEAQAANQEQEYTSNLASRGIARAPIANEGYRQIRAGVGTQVMAMQNNLIKAKIDADYADKTEAINEGIAWLNSLRDYTARMAATSAQYKIGMANVNLGYAQLAQQLQIVREQYQQQLQLLLFQAG